MVSPLGAITSTLQVGAAVAGNLGGTTASFYLLDPTGTVPVEPLIDLVPGVSPLRVTFDMIDSEQGVFEYDVTEHAVGSLFDITSNVRKRLESITIVGFLGASPPLTPLPAPPVPGSFLRLDILRARNLKQLQKVPIMVVTPRLSLARALITSIQQSWTPAMGESLQIAVTVRELRLVSPLLGASVVPDYPAQAPGNNAAKGGGQSATSTVSSSATPGTAGSSPTVGNRIAP